MEIWAILWQGIAILSATPDMDIEPIGLSDVPDMGLYELIGCFRYGHL